MGSSVLEKELNRYMDGQMDLVQSFYQGTTASPGLCYRFCMKT